MFLQSVLTAGLFWAPAALAGYNAGATDNIAIYWGQNSAGISNADKSQKSLAEYCANTDVDIIPIAFLAKFNPMEIDLTNMDDDENMGQEIASCQQAGKTVLLSIGGSMFTQGPSSQQHAQLLADQVWGMFGPKGNAGNSITRPFGDAVVDGFDLDIEAVLPNIAPFAARLRENIDKANSGGSRKFYLSAAPQCPFPDVNNEAILHGDNAIAFDFVMVQFYNNPVCDIRVFAVGSDPKEAGFNMAQWDEWARSSKNPNMKVFLGIPGGPTAVTSTEKASYKAPNMLAPIVAYSKSFSSFGGVMIWDMSQVYANDGFLAAIANDVKAPAASGGPSNTNTMRQSSHAHARRLRRTHQRDVRL
ncbi:glycoside hydrolase family 18 protein [Hypoxylon fragiforme]|uniref:glycoside hydrolase family 18 protein n=1 Tax=Hypoxylon fragiforme TaxID=63214 RepID=UPI0020C6227A|nr:glycoside hydrolase family 18 protein [Hypoxylon fragiforme]KAI2611557.1 glycoside hydrolase family 18 protein [Hypoxylon fragiforme]